MLNRFWYKKSGAVSMVVFLLGLNICVSAVQDSVSADQPEYFTPDCSINQQLRTGEIKTADVFGLSQTDEGLVVNPLLDDGWTWLAAKNVEFQGERLSFFFYDGWLYTDVPVFTSYRRQKFKMDASRFIHSNVFSMAFYAEKVIEKELVIFLASEVAVEAEIIIDEKLWGEEKRITYSLEAGQGHFISVQKMADEYRPLFIPHDDPLRKHVDLNKNWKFIRKDIQRGYGKKINDREWEEVSVPHCWNKKDVHDTRNIFDGYEIFHEPYRGAGWYRKEILLDDALKDKKIFIDFEGANQKAEVWMNEHYLGKHEGGFTGFSFDVTDVVRYGKKSNILAVRVDNAYDYDVLPHSVDFMPYGGLYRDVRMRITENVYLHDIHVTTPDVSFNKGQAELNAFINNDSDYEKQVTVRSNIVNRDAEIEATVQTVHQLQSHSTVDIQQRLPEVLYPRLWSPESPYLYQIYSTVIVDGHPVDEIITSLGFRWFHFDADEGFFLNDRHVKLKGVNKHQDYYGLGAAVPDSLQVRDIELIKEMGANFIRLAHYPHDPSVLEACDRLGLLVWGEIPFVNSAGGIKFAENALQMMREMIQRDWNHPSVILWGITNETTKAFAHREEVLKIEKLLQDLHDLARREDPDRLTIQAHNFMKEVRIADITDAIGRNRYYGWYLGEFKDFDKAMDLERLEHPEWITIISEYGVGSKRGYHVDDPKAFDFSEEFQLNFHEHYWKAITQRPWIAGGALWNAMDYGSFVKRGNIPRINQKGLMDMARRPKDAYYFYKSQWTDEPMVYLVSHTRRFFHGTAGESKRIRVYSNCDAVELTLNGISLGEKEKQYVYSWDVALAPGENELKTVARQGNKIVEDAIRVHFITEDDR